MLPSYTADSDLASIQLVATDMDLTLLHDDKSMPTGMDERIEALAQRGIVFCAASGRPLPALRESFADSWERMALVGDNGGTVWYEGKTIFRSLIDVALYQELLGRVIEDGRGIPVLCSFEEAYVLERHREHHEELSIYYKKIIYVPSFTGIAADVNKVSILCPAWNSTELFREVFGPEFGGRLYVTCAGGEWIDFMNLGVDKGAGIRHLAEHLGIELADVAAFGDTYNDIPMLDIVGHSIIVSNAAAHMEAHARFCCPSNTDEGVPEALDAIIAAR